MTYCSLVGITYFAHFLVPYSFMRVKIMLEGVHWPTKVWKINTNFIYSKLHFMDYSQNCFSIEKKGFFFIISRKYHYKRHVTKLRNCAGTKKKSRKRKFFTLKNFLVYPGGSPKWQMPSISWVERECNQEWHFGNTLEFRKYSSSQWPPKVGSDLNHLIFLYKLDKDLSF